MSCYAPIQAYRSGLVNPVSGKRAMQFKLQGSFSGVRQMLPCGKCIGCRLEHARRWAIRCVHESKLHADNCFLTLTYNEASLPQAGTLVPRHLQLFQKRLHNRLLDSRGRGFRFFSVGEYGDINRRPHYHCLIFGYDFTDKVKYGETSYGIIYTSKLLDEIWGFGECKIAELSYKTANYVTRYCLKKVDGKKRLAGHYEVYDANGEIFERHPEFARMSRRPGIGAGYFDRYGREVQAHDNLIINAREVPSIRFYDLRIEAKDPAGFELIKKKRRASRKWSEGLTDRRRVKEKLAIITTKQKERKL
ncbi:replication initiator protein [robinz microvirus RP_102]|nr:replication initiator protein [robinz microvirus RP_102]